LLLEHRQFTNNLPGGLAPVVGVNAW